MTWRFIAMAQWQDQLIALREDGTLIRIIMNFHSSQIEFHIIGRLPNE